MIQRLIRRVFRLGSRAGPVIIPRSEHGIGRDRLSHGSRRTCETLQNAGYQAYVVGGAVRDLLLGLQPEDFDVATNALPEDVRRLFRRSRLIGRRFKIAHVMFGDETVEVSTFRSGGAEDKDEHGRVLRDNEYGTIEQDAARRDFTVNALYYDPSNEAFLDFHQGLKDLRRKIVRIIGDPRLRYREDPVRMLRAARFAAKLQFKIDQHTGAPIAEMADLLGNVPAARLFDEMLKLLLSGHAGPTLHQLRDEGLHHGLLPLLDVILEQPLGERFVNLALEQTDARVRAGKFVSPAFLFAALLWHQVLAAWRTTREKGINPVPALHQAMDAVLDKQTDKLAIPRRFTAVMKEIWILQPRFEQRSGKRPFSLLHQERFRAGFDFLALRAQSGEVDNEVHEWWQRFQHAPPEEQHAMLLQPAAGERTTHRRRRRRKKRASAAAPDV
ncbi:MAG: poly(A) polymerase [Betaproteobacteria bacterium RBG_16_64_9]|nr:MAG: poly(A) polymerase [Betaproteobacteria bacterium RBG_16_64_9]OGA30259.1 MAG: poly(A) polymerase [Betaproteobacteria bacterium RIFCSPLOWO2_02_FULL_65_24]OGA96912.1 MAG: poly(A) polymerase [Betaproteobacteria bacterium RIFCSPLOWO2_12_FULL_66_14]